MALTLDLESNILSSLHYTEMCYYFYYRYVFVCLFVWLVFFGLLFPIRSKVFLYALAGTRNSSMEPP